MIFTWNFLSVWPPICFQKSFLVTLGIWTCVWQFDTLASNVLKVHFTVFCLVRISTNTSSSFINAPPKEMLFLIEVVWNQAKTKNRITLYIFIIISHTGLIEQQTWLSRIPICLGLQNMSFKIIHHQNVLPYQVLHK